MPGASAALAGGRPGQARAIDYGRIGLISAGHLFTDLYGNLLTAFMPYLVLQGRITATLAGLILLVYLLGSSILQPIFGLMADQSGRRVFVVLGPIAVGICTVSATLAPNAVLIFVLAALAGIGISAFHPQAAAMVSNLSARSKGWTMSIFSMGGNVGFALGPVLAAGIALVGLRWSPVVLAPGLLLTLVFARFAPAVSVAGIGSASQTLRDAAASSWRSLSLIVTVIATRSAAQYALIIFLPLYYHGRGFPAELGSVYAFVLSLAGALGGLAGGHASDRFGRKIVIVLTLLASVPLLSVLLQSTGPVIWPLLAASGAALLASNSVTVVQGQELLPGNTGVASGLTLGLGFGLSGIIASILTSLSDHIGVADAVLLVPALPLLAAVLAALVPDRPALAPTPAAAG
jgi:FSR family fosmidomycin resistance protein-like MFS transporter